MEGVLGLNRLLYFKIVSANIERHGRFYNQIRLFIKNATYLICRFKNYSVVLFIQSFT